MCAYSLDLRVKVVAAAEREHNKHAVARSFGISVSTVKRYVKQWQTEETLAPKPHPGRPPTIRPDQQETLRAHVTAHPAAYLDEYCALWEAATGVRVSLSAMSREIRRLGFTRKKGRWVPASATRMSGRAGTRT
jgi:transposase